MIDPFRHLSQRRRVWLTLLVVNVILGLLILAFALWS